MVKVVDTALKRDLSGFYTIKIELTHDELNILVDALNVRIHRPLSDPDEMRAVLELNTKIFGFWENTSDNPNPVDPTLIKIPDMPCPENAKWDANIEKCVPIAGHFEDKDGVFKPIPVNDCGNNAHFDQEKGCICDDGFVRDKETGLCIPIEDVPPPK